MAYCRNCGAQISDTAVFCTECGYKLKEHEKTEYKETKVEVTRPAEASHDISDVIINISNLQSAVLRLSSKLSTEDTEKISSNLVESLDMLGSIAKSPNIKAPQSRIPIERLMLIIERIKKCADSLQTVSEDKEYHIRALLDSSNELREKAIALKDEINAIIYRPTRISVVSILLVIIGFLLFIASVIALSNIQRISSPIFVIYLVAGILGIISGIGLWKMRLWAAILGIITVSIFLIESFRGGSFIGILFNGTILLIILSAMKYYIGIYPRAVVRRDIPKESNSFSGRKVNYLSILGGILAILSIPLPWWFISSSFASMSISLISLGQLSQGVSIGSLQISLREELADAVNIALISITIGGFLGFIGARYKIARILGILAILIGAISFVSGLSRTITPLGLYGSISAFGLSASWGLDLGFYVAIVSIFILLLSLKQE